MHFNLKRPTNKCVDQSQIFVTDKILLNIYFSFDIGYSFTVY